MLTSSNPEVLAKTVCRSCNTVYVMLSVLLALSAVMYLSATQTLPVIEDTIGYIYAGQRLASGHGPTYEDVNNQISGPYFSMYAFQVRRDDDSPRTFLGFPPGFPVLLAGAIVAIGNSIAAYYVVPLLAVLGILATFWLGRLIGSNDWTGLWAATILTISPTYLEFGTSSWSEIPSLAFITLGVCLYLFVCRDLRYRQKTGLLLSILGGLSIAYSFFIRYTNLVILPALGIYELYIARKKLFTEWERWVFFVPVGLGLAAIPVFNHFYYGGALTTSYSPVHGWYPWAPFSLSYALGPSFINGFSLIETGKTLWYNFPWLLLTVPMGWGVLKRASALLISLATLGFISIYAFYAFAPVGVNRRFLLPAFPFLTVSIGQAITRTGGKLCNRRWQRWIAAVFLVALLCWPVPSRIKQLRDRKIEGPGMVKRVQSMVASTPSNAVFLSYVYNDQIAFYGHRSVLNYRRIPPSDPDTGSYRLDVLEPCLVEAIDHLLENQIPVYYVKDKSPPFWNSLAILERNFTTELVNEGPDIYRVFRPANTGTRERLPKCDQ